MSTWACSFVYPTLVIILHNGIYWEEFLEVSLISVNAIAINLEFVWLCIIFVEDKYVGK